MQKIKFLIPVFISSAFILASCNGSKDQPIVEKEFSIKSRDTIAPPALSLRTDPADILNERKLTAHITDAPFILPNKKAGVPFNTLEYDKIIAYDFDGSEKVYPAVIDEKGKFVPVIAKQKYLSQQQADKITAALSKNSSYGAGTAACFEPHLGLVFYKNDTMVNQINICMGCNYLISKIPIPARDHNVINKGKEDEYALIGFTASGKKAIKQLCKEINFYYGGND